MKVQLLDQGIFVCPHCIKRGKEIALELIAEASAVEGDDVKHGELRCSACNSSYPIIEGIAIFPTLQEAKKYGSEAVAQSYLLTQYRDRIAETMELALADARNDLTGYFSNAKRERYYDDLVDLLKDRIAKDSRILDIGCAVGRLSRKLARHGGFVIGIDISLAEVKLAREILLRNEGKVCLGLTLSSGSSTHKQSEVFMQLEEASQSNVEFIVADAELLPFRSEYFDVICASSVIDRVPDIEQFIGTVDRIAHDGTTLLLASPFDFSEKYTSKDKWLGLKAFGTSEGPAETALKQLMRKHHYHLIREKDIRWTHYSDRRHHSVWSVYSAVFEAWRYEIARWNSKGKLSQSLIDAYTRVFAEDVAFNEVNSVEDAQRGLGKMDLLIVAKRQRSDEVLGFTGGTIVRIDQLEGPSDKIAAYEMLVKLGGDRIFAINELGVLTEYQGAGIGSHLLEELLSDAKAAGTHTYTLVTASTSSAISFYKQRGFSILTNSQGPFTQLIEQLRTDGRVRTDARPRLFRVDEFVQRKLSNQRTVYLELCRPSSIKHKESLRPLARQISELFGRAFWHSDDPEKRWQVDSIMQRLSSMPLMILAMDEERQAIGYSMFRTVTSEDGLVLVLDSTGVSGGSKNFPQNWQHCGLGLELLKEGIRQTGARILAARTQNSIVVSMIPKLDALRSSEDKERIELLPLDAGFSKDDRKLMGAVARQLPETAEEELDFTTGIFKRTYPEGKLGDYDINPHDNKLRNFEDRVRQLDPSWSRDQGDAVLLIAKNIPWIT